MCRADIGLVVDTSGSIKKALPGLERNWDTLLDFLKQIVDAVDYGLDNTRIGEVYFGNNARVHFDLNDCPDKACINQKILSTPFTVSFK